MDHTRSLLILVAGAVIAVAAPSARAQGEPKGTVIVVNRMDATVSLVDLASRAITAAVPVDLGPREAAVSPDGRRALISNYGDMRVAGNTLSLIDLESASLVQTISLGAHRRPHGVAWLPDGQRALVVSESDSALLIVDVARGAVTAAIALGEPGPQLVTLGADGTRAYVSAVTRASVTLVDVAGRRAVRSVPVPSGAGGLALRPDGRELWVTSSTANRITALSGDSLATVATIESQDRPIRVRFTPDGGQALATHAGSSELKIYDVATHAQREAIQMRVSRSAMHGGTGSEGYENKTVPIGLLMLPGGGWAIVGNAGADAISLVSLKDNDIAQVIFVGRGPDGLAYSPIVRPPPAE